MRKALVVGIESAPFGALDGCLQDAEQVAELLSRNDDGSLNFDVRLLTEPPEQLSRARLWASIEELFEDTMDISLFYYAGHGYVRSMGGHIATSGPYSPEEGIAMDQILLLANRSAAKERIIILDCCHSGAFGNPAMLDGAQGFLSDGVSVIAASRRDESAIEEHGEGVFTSLLCEGLSGGAADICGRVTTGSVYTYVENVLGAWDQRPMFKANVSRFTPIRQCPSAVSVDVLQRLPKLFPDPESDKRLDPSYEPDSPPLHPEHEQEFYCLQKLRDGRLLEPVGEEHLYYAAVRSASCRLTPLGRHYWRMAQGGRL